MIGWVANVLMWVGSICVGNSNRYGFLAQLVGNAMWAWIGYTGAQEENKSALIVVSIVFCCIYARNFFKWGRRPQIKVFEQ